MKAILIVITASLCACGTEQSLSTAQHQFDALTAEARDASNCGQQNSECVQSSTFAPRNHACRSEMRACIAALRPPLAGQHSPALDELHACNATYAGCAEVEDEPDDDGVMLDGGTGDCEAAHRACLCTVFTDGWSDFCASVAASCANDTSARCARLTERCTQPAPQQPGLCD